jgi:RNA polymerase sigma-70 factor (ECF subfamily)
MRNDDRSVPDLADVAQLYVEHAPRILRFLRAALRNADDAEDVMQEVFLKAYRALRRGVRPVSAGPWLFAIARTTSIDCAKSRARLQPVEPAVMRRLTDAAGSSPACGSASWITSCEVRAAVERLPPREHEVIVLRYVFGCSHRQSATVLGCSEGSVRQSHHHALKVLARVLADTAPASSTARHRYAMRTLRLPRRFALAGFTLLRPSRTAGA